MHEFYRASVNGNRFIIGHADIDFDGGKAASTLCSMSDQTPMDGLLIWDRKGSVIRVRMWNPDGSEDFCANGTACVALIAARRVQSKNLNIQTVRGGITAQMRDKDTNFVELSLHNPSFCPHSIPIRLASGQHLLFRRLTLGGRTFRFMPISTGTAHCVIPVAKLPDDRDFFRFSRQIENHPVFPQRTSVLWVRACGGRIIDVRIWERGVGETAACGSGAVAAATVFAKVAGRFGWWKVRTSGGISQVRAKRAGRPLLRVRVHEPIDCRRANILDKTLLRTIWRSNRMLDA